MRENDLFFAADPKCFTIEAAGLGRFLHRHAVTSIRAKPLRQSRPLLTQKFLTTASVSRGACAACGGFGTARNTAAAFHVFYWLQVTNLSFLKSAPN
jgi:hypothetical protein